MANWLSKAWRRNRSAIGNLAKNVSPLLSFTPLGPLGSGALAVIGEAARGKGNLKDMLKAGISNAAIGSGAKAGVGAVRSAFTPGSNAVAAAGNTSYTQTPGGEWINAANNAPVTAAAPAPPGVGGSSVGGSNPLRALSRPASAVKNVVKKDPLAAMQLTGNVLGGVMESRAMADQTGLQRERFDFEKQQVSEAEQRRRLLQELLAPMLQPRGF